MKNHRLFTAALLLALFLILARCTPYLGVGINGTIGAGGVTVGPDVGVGFAG